MTLEGVTEEEQKAAVQEVVAEAVAEHAQEMAEAAPGAGEGPAKHQVAVYFVGRLLDGVQYAVSACDAGLDDEGAVKLTARVREAALSGEELGDHVPLMLLHFEPATRQVKVNVSGATDQRAVDSAKAKVGAGMPAVAAALHRSLQRRKPNKTFFMCFEDPADMDATLEIAMFKDAAFDKEARKFLTLMGVDVPSRSEAPA